MREKFNTGTILILCFAAIYFIQTLTNFPAFLYTWIGIIIIAYIEIIAKSFKKPDSFIMIALSTFIVFVTCKDLILFAETITPSEFSEKIIILVASVALCDSMAQIVGKNWGNSKLAKSLFKGKTALAPEISPNKTNLGAVAGVLSCALTYALLKHFFLKDSFLIYFTVGIFIGITAVLGDLAASCFKRNVDIKDSGIHITSHILKGHGGFLDRFDSHIAVLAIFCWLI